MAMTAAVKDELAGSRSPSRAAARPRCPRCCGSPAACTSSPGGSWSRPSSTPAPPPAGCARTSPRCTATRSDIVVVAPGGLRKGNRYVVRVVKDGEAWPGRPAWSTAAAVRSAGCRPQVVSGPVCDSEAAWRGAFLAHGSLTEPGRSSALEITCPGPEAALALVGAARRLGIAAKAREVRGVDRVVVRDGDAISALLTRLGAHERVLAWEERRMRREVRATANRLANFDDANLRRSARAAVAAGARVQRALEILGDDVPEHLADGRPAAPRAPAGQPRGARRARRPADDQGRDRRPDPAAARHGRQARRGARASPAPRPT